MKSPLNWMLLVVPIAIVLELSHADPLYIFTASAIAIIPLAVNLIASDGESKWMEGVQLLAVYAILGLAFYTMPA